MKTSKESLSYKTPETDVMQIEAESVLCQSVSFGLELEDMEEKDYTFEF